MSSCARIIVVVVAYQSDRWLLDCVRTLASGWNPRDALLIVDNSGNTDVAEAARLIPGTQVVVTPKRLGFAEANNCGLVHCTMEAEAICFLNQDTLSGSCWLDACMKCLDSDSQLGAVSPVLTTFDGSAWDEGFAYCTREVTKFSDSRPGNPLNGCFNVPLLTAAAMLIRADLLRRIGPFDPVFGSYYEDFDLCRRIREAGYGLAICGTGVVRHFGGSATTSAAAEYKRTRQLVRNRLIHRLRCAGTRRMRCLCQYLAIEFPYNLGRCLVGTRSAPPLSAFLRAHRDLVPLLRRLLSESRDQLEFQAYLTQLHWPRSAGSVAAMPA